ncbi:MAG: toxic anion resistance protein [Clostridia bacterium]|nr:toxic anion resistance protein [Clostridia bacterium]MBQ9409577.1 toxic anion resistance protein [Clostridia bacterium]
MSENQFTAAATAVIPEFEEALKKIDVEIDTKQDPEKLEKERKAIYDAIREVEKTDIKETADVFAFGNEVQNDLSHFSDTALARVKTKDLGEVGDMISNLVVELKGFTVDEKQKRGIFSWFKKKASKIELLKTRFDTASTNVDAIVKALNSHKITLLNDIVLLDELYDENLKYFKTLTVYIQLGKQKLENFRNTEIAEAVALAQRTNLPEDAQAAKDLNDKADRFEKKLYDLELTRNISIQMAPQIRLIQSSDTVMVEKIQSTIVNTIPVWKSQMVMALGIEHSQQAMEAQQAVTNLTNDLLKKNAENLHMATVATARAAERGVIDVETLTYTNQKLIETMDEVLKIQNEGKEKRRAAEETLKNIEQELKQKLLEFKG